MRKKVKGIRDKVKEKTEKILLKSINHKLSIKDNHWIENTYKLISILDRASENKKGRVKKAFFMIVLCLVILGLLLSFRVGDIEFPFLKSLNTNNISFSIKAKTLQLFIEEGNDDLNLVNLDSQVICKSIEVEPISELQFSTTFLPENLISGASFFSVRGDSIILNDLHFDKGASIEIEQGKVNTKFLFFKTDLDGATIFPKGQLQIQTLDTLIVGDDDYPEFMDFKSSRLSDIGSIKLELNPVQDVNILRGKLISDIKFTREYYKGATNVEYSSSIIKGKIKFLDIDKEIEILDNERVVFEQPRGRIQSLILGNGFLELNFIGSVKEVKTGVQYAEKRHSPSLLFFLYKNKNLIMIWGSFIFLIGILGQLQSKLLA